VTSADRNRVLVVEDEPIIRRVLEDGLTDAGFHVTTAANGAVALDRVRQHRPDAVLLDLLMPVMDGLAFLRERQHHPLLASVPVVVLSAGGLPTLRAAIALRATAALPKPVDLDILSAVLDYVVRDFGRAPEHLPGDVPTTDWPQPQPVGTCPMCGHTVFARVDQRFSRAEQLAEVYAARRAHVMAHTAGDLAYEPLRAKLSQLPLDRRRILASWMYPEVRQDWGDRDRRGVFSIDEVLHSPSLHRLWLDAATCDLTSGCRHS
jgi:CheY-like chemotaxis protein